MDKKLKARAKPINPDVTPKQPPTLAPEVPASAPASQQAGPSTSSATSFGNGSDGVRETLRSISNQPTSFPQKRSRDQTKAMEPSSVSTRYRRPWTRRDHPFPQTRTKAATASERENEVCVHPY
jgi:hypothetical protein